MNPTKVINDERRLTFNLMGLAKVANIHEIKYRFLETLLKTQYLLSSKYCARMVCKVPFME